MPSKQDVQNATAGGAGTLKQPWVTGLKEVAGAGTPSVARVDIDVLWNDNPKAFNIFVQALAALQSKDNFANPMSFFQIAGIHGCPKIPWNGVDGKNLRLDIQSGYCAHSQPQFPTWHRPYLAMMEQTLYTKMLEIANSYNAPYKAEYLQAVDSFRLPYWDYFRPRGADATFPGVIKDGQTGYPYDFSLPRVVTDTSLNVLVAPDNHSVPIQNPLCRFGFQGDKSITATEWSNMNPNTTQLPQDRTVRYPNGTEYGNVASLNSVLNSFRMDCNRLALNIVEDDAYKIYEVFADDRSRNPKFQAIKANIAPWASGSIEGLHDQYHVLLGGGGHVGRVPVAAFDPLFWLHHCNIDRLFAIWQAVHSGEPGSWFTTPAEASKPLLPFRKKSSNQPGDFWTSQDSKACDDFGYTYPDLAVPTGATVRSEFDRRYTWSVPLVSSTAAVIVPSDMKPLDFTKSPFCKDYKAPAPSNAAPAPAPAMSSRIAALKVQVPMATMEPIEEFAYEWFVDDQVERMALNGSFGIYYFINDKDDAPLELASEFLLTPTIAGVHYIFAAPTEICDNCGQQQEQAQVVSGTAAITSMLLDYKEVQPQSLSSLTPEDVVPFLKKRLRWRVYDADKTEKDTRWMAKEKGLAINLSLKKSRLPRGSRDATYEDFPEVIAHIISQASTTATSRQS